MSDFSEEEDDLNIQDILEDEDVNIMDITEDDIRKMQDISEDDDVNILDLSDIESLVEDVIEDEMEPLVEYDLRGTHRIIVLDTSKSNSREILLSEKLIRRLSSKVQGCRIEQRDFQKNFWRMELAL